MDDLVTTIVHILPIHGTSVVGFQLNYDLMQFMLRCRLHDELIEKLFSFH